MSAQWSYTLLPENPRVLQTLRYLARAWRAQGLTLHPTPGGDLTYFPKRLTAEQKALVRQMQPYKPLLSAIYAAHPAIEMFASADTVPHTVCRACFQLIPLQDGCVIVHQFLKQPCPGGVPPRQDEASP